MSLYTGAAIHGQRVSGVGREFRCGMPRSGQRQSTCIRLCPSVLGTASPALQLQQQEMPGVSSVLDSVHVQTDRGNYQGTIRVRVCYALHLLFVLHDGFDT